MPYAIVCHESDTISGKYLDEFLRILKATHRHYEKQQDEMLASPPAAGEAERYSVLLSSASQMADFYEWFAKDAEIVAKTYGELSPQRLESIIFSYRGQGTKPKPLGHEGEFSRLQRVNEAIGGGTMYTLSGNEDERGLGLLKLGAREHGMETLMQLRAMQEGKTDEWICTKILRAEKADPALCRNGVISLPALAAQRKKANAWREGISAEDCNGQAHKYASHLKLYHNRPRPGGMLDVFARADISRQRADFELVTSEMYAALGEQGLKLKQQELLAAAAKEVGLAPETLRAGPGF